MRIRAGGSRLQRRLVYYVAVSTDGFIADIEGRTQSFAADEAYLLELAELYPETIPTHLRANLGVDAPARRFDAVLLGRRTHQLALDAGLTSGFPHLQQHVFTTRADLPADATVQVHRGDPVAIVAALRVTAGRDLWLAGGGDLASQLADEIDEFILKVNPVVLGDGVPLLRGVTRPLPLHLLSTRWFDNGVALLQYERCDR